MLSKIFVKRLANFEISSVKILTLNEITPENAAKLLKQAKKNDFTSYSCNWEREGFGDNEDFSLDYYANVNYKIDEKLFSEKICKYQRDTLFIFVESTENLGFSPRFIANLQEDIYILELIGLEKIKSNLKRQILM